MKVQKAVKRYTLTIAAGVVILSAVMLGVFVLLGKFDSTVLLGALWGSCFSVLNFFLMGLSVQSATEMPVEPDGKTEEPQTAEFSKDGKATPLNDDAKKIRQKMQFSYYLRMLMLVAAAIAALVAPCFHPIAAVMPLLFPRIVIIFQRFFRLNEE